MKTNRYQRRFYREWVKAKDLYLMRVAVGETDLQLLSDRPLDKGFVREKIRAYRRDIESYINRNNSFLITLKPLEVEPNAKPIIKEMAHAARKADVGPMAAVAGAIAQFLGRALLKKGCKEVIIENGGDIFLVTRKVRKIGIYAGKLKLWKNLALKIKPQDTPLGICASSGTIGHSLSFGCADSAVILAHNASLADAAATATANRIHSKADLGRAIEFARSLGGVLGAVLIFKKNLAIWGKAELAK